MTTSNEARRPNILVLVEDQWQMHMRLPPDVPLPALRRLEAEGVSFDRHYCTVPICTPSRAAMWTGQHAVNIDMWDNTNFAWLPTGLNPDVPTIGDLLREHGYYTAFKGKWHLSAMPLAEDALEPYGFSDVQKWGEMYGAPMQGIQLDHAVAFEAVDWLENRGSTMQQPWLLVVSLVNPHDVMFMVPGDGQEVQARPEGFAHGAQHTIQDLDFFKKQWEVGLPENFDDDLDRHPPGVRSYKEYLELNFGQPPDDRADLWLAHRNYLVNCMRLVDKEFKLILDAMDRLRLWDDTVVIYTGDHGEMNGAHRLTQKAGIAFDEAVVVPFIVRTPGGEQGRRSAAVGSLLDLAPTLLDFAGVPHDDVRRRYPQLKGRSLKGAVLDPGSPGPRGSADAPGDGALYMWDALHALDNDWAATGALQMVTNLGGRNKTPEEWREVIREAGTKYGPPDMTKRTFFRTVVDGRYKLVRWLSPSEYGVPASIEDLYGKGDVGLYDLVEDPGELENLGDPHHPRHDPEVLRQMLRKLQALIANEIGEDRIPFDPAMFGG